MKRRDNGMEWIQMAGITIEGVDEVVLMGAATRMPLVQKTLQEHVKRYGI